MVKIIFIIDLEKYKCQKIVMIFFNDKKGWISQLYDAHGNHVGTRHMFFKDEAHLTVTKYDSSDTLLSIEHIFSIDQSLSYLSYDQITMLTKKISASENSKLFEPDKDFEQRFLGDG